MSQTTRQQDDDPMMKVIEGIELVGGSVNTSDDEVLANVKASIRRQHPQIKQQGVQHDRVALVDRKSTRLNSSH